LDKLRDIVNELKSSEIELIQSSYGPKGKAISKKLKLLNLVLDKKEHTDQSASKLIYGHAPDSKFSQLKKRLKNDILNIILVQPTALCCDTDPIEADIYARKLFLQGRILQQKGINDEAIDLFNKALQVSHRYEIVDLKIVIYDTLRTMIYDRSDEDSVMKCTANINMCLNIQMDLLKAKAMHYDVATNYEEETILEDNVSALRYLRNSYQESSSMKTGFWYHMAELQFFKVLKAYKKAYICSRKILTLISDKPQIASKEHFSLVKLEIGRISIFLGKYGKAINYAKQVLDSCKIKDLCSLEPLEVMYFGHTRRKEYEEAKRMVKKARIIIKGNPDTGLSAKWTLYEAYLKFFDGQYSESNALLNNLYVLNRGQSEIAFAVRTLELINMIELGESDWLDFKIENFRKALQRNKMCNLSRYNVIHKILNSLIKSNCNYDLTVSNEQESLNKLNKTEGLYQWDGMGYEVLNFIQWYNKHLTEKLQGQYVN
jgi:tetratricopeptide (TPR) repeat protein